MSSIKGVFIIQCEDHPDFQEYVDADGKRIPSGQDVGVEVEIDGEVEFCLLDGIYYSEN